MNNSVRISIYNIILNYIFNRGFQDYDNFSRKLTEAILEDFAKGHFDLRKTISKVKTSFFRLNSISRSQFFNKRLEKAIVNTWKNSSKITEPLTERTVKIIYKTPLPSHGVCKELQVDDIDSFIEVSKVKPSEVANLIPLDLDEEFIKNSLAEIIGETFVQKDWGGELGDLFSTRIKFRGHRISTAFMFKGKGLRKKLTIADCGKNGDQILRLLKLPARLFIVQHVGEIDFTVREQLEMATETKARQTGKALYYCLMDGVDTARVLLAYGKLDSN